MKTKFLSSLFLIILAMEFSPILAHGAAVRFYFETPTSRVTPGSEILVRVLVDAPEPLNAYHITLQYASANFDVVSFDDSHSIIAFWQSPPKDQGGTIDFSGGSITPFQGNKGELLTLRLRAKQEGTMALRFNALEAYIADGKGTLVDAAREELPLVVASNAQDITEPTPSDETPPRIDTVSVVPDPFGVERMLVSFSAHDSESGIKGVVVRSKSWFSWGSWQTALNPVLFPSEAWALELRAYDNVGNFSKYLVYRWSVFGKRILELFLVFLALFLGHKYFRKRRKGVL